MYDYIRQYKSEIKRIFNNCAKNDKRAYTKQYVDSLYTQSLINYKEWKKLTEFTNTYVNNTLR